MSGAPERLWPADEYDRAIYEHGYHDGRASAAAESADHVKMCRVLGDYWNTVALLWGVLLGGVAGAVAASLWWLP